MHMRDSGACHLQLTREVNMSMCKNIEPLGQLKHILLQRMLCTFGKAFRGA